MPAALSEIIIGTRNGLPDLQVLAWCGSAGDQSPHPQLRKAADARTRKLHGNVSETRAIAQRLADAVDYA